MSLPYFPMYPSDFEAKTSHLTIAEDGAYNRLLRICWMTPGCSMPADEAWIMRRARAHDDAEKAAVLAVLEEFFTVENGRYSNARLRIEWLAANEAHEKRKNAGAKGGNAKALKSKDSHSSNAVAKPKQPEPEPEPELKKEDTNVSLQVSPANDVSEAVTIYNETATRTGWPCVQKMTPSRSKQIRGRLTDCGGVDGWRCAVDRAEQSDFLSGRTSRPWSGFGFDWLVKAANFTKLMEGNYDNRDQHQHPAGGRQDRPDAALEQIYRLARVGDASGNGRG